MRGSFAESPEFESLAAGANDVRIARIALEIARTRTRSSTLNAISNELIYSPSVRTVG